MPKPTALILRAAGVNCERETAYAWEQVGAEATVVHINELIDRPHLLDNCQILTVPGGFSYGDDIAAGRILANQLQHRFGDALRAHCAHGGLILGICNGFQVLCKAGLLPCPTNGLPTVTITNNRSRRYEDRWVHLERGVEHCAFLQQDGPYNLPVAHGEGRVAVESPAVVERLAQAGCTALRYRTADGTAPGYPDNPNGSCDDLAGLCDPTGRIFGLMPHPERFLEITHHPEWTSTPVEPPHGRLVFESAVHYLH